MNEKTIRVKFESLGSTNDKAREIVLKSHTRALDDSLSYGDVLPLLVTAAEQTAGRGRYGKSFYSPADTGIYMSYAYEHAYTEEELLGVTTRVAELILPVLQAHCSSELRIKPINDIYVLPADTDTENTSTDINSGNSPAGDIALPPGSRKAVGILTERVDYPDKTGYFIIVGIGINCEPYEVPENLLDTEGNKLSDIIGFLEPDCSHEQLIEELLNALGKLHK